MCIYKDFVSIFVYYLSTIHAVIVQTVFGTDGQQHKKSCASTRTLFQLLSVYWNIIHAAFIQAVLEQMDNSTNSHMHLQGFIFVLVVFLEYHTCCFCADGNLTDGQMDNSTNSHMHLQGCCFNPCGFFALLSMLVSCRKYSNRWTDGQWHKQSCASARTLFQSLQIF